jgi:hypothetical protein
MTPAAAASVQEYLASLPADRRATLSKVRQVIRRNLPKGYRESICWGLITYSIPLERFPDTYNGQPLCYVALGSQKNYCSLYLMTVYGDPKQAAWLKAQFVKAGKKLDMGKSCVRFKRVSDLPLDAIAELIGRTTPEAYIACYKASRKRK